MVLASITRLGKLHGYCLTENFSSGVIFRIVLTTNKVSVSIKSRALDVCAPFLPPFPETRGKAYQSHRRLFPSALSCLILRSHFRELCL